MSIAVTSPTPAPSPIGLGYHEIPLADLHPSPLNPRKRVTDVEALAASVGEVGILEPLLVRPLPAARGYEVVAGGRRLEAAQKAGLLVAPCLVRELGDAAALELAIVENNQRGDIHPLEEAEAFQRLTTLDRSYTPEAIAAKIGRPLAYVKARLKLLDLHGPAREAFAQGEIALGHAQLLAKLAPAVQKKALERCFDQRFDYGSGHGRKEMAKVSRLQDFINEHVPLDVAAPETQEEFPELATELAKATAAGATVLMLSEAYNYGSSKPKAGAPLTHDQWNEVKPGEKAARRGVIVQGGRRGRALWVRLKADEPKPQRSASDRGVPKTAEEKAAEQKRRDAVAKKQAKEKAAAERRTEVLRRAVQALTMSVAAADLTSAAGLRVLASALQGGGFDDALVREVAAQHRIPERAFGYNGEKHRLKLSVPDLVRVVAVMAVGADWDFNRHARDAGAAAFDAFGIDLAAIDRDLAADERKSGAATKNADAKKTAKAGKAPAARKAAKKR